MARKEREDPFKKYGSKFLNEQSRRDYQEQKRREEQATRMFFPRKKSDEDRNQKSVAFERKWNP